MTFDLAVIALSDKGVQVALDDGSPAFWLPRQHVEWRGLLEPGEMVTADIPRWIIVKHRQLQHVRGQYAFPLNQTPGLDPVRSQEKIPMASDYPQDAGKGMLGRNSKAEKPSHPSHTGVCDIAGRRYRIAAWVKTSEKTGEKYFSLSFREEQPRSDERQQPAQPKPASVPTFDSDIPFLPDR